MDYATRYKLFTTLCNPKCNGLCERINGVLKSMLKKMCHERPKDWDRYLPSAYREIPQTSTGFSPFELLYGRKIRGPMDIWQDLWAGTNANLLKKCTERDNGGKFNRVIRSFLKDMVNIDAYEDEVLSHTR